MICAILQEMEYRKAEVDVPVETLYFGGGTPSVLSISELSRFFNSIEKHFPLTEKAEITLEVNPDDLTPEYALLLKTDTPVNRLSIGIQAFQDRHLQLMNRRHSGEEARKSIETALSAGFENLNIDLIYGIPGLSLQEWKENLGILTRSPVPHLSAYHLGIEPKTVFGNMLQKGKIKEIAEEESLEQFNLLLDFTESLGYDHYEISNFALEGHHSKHNLGYWQGKPYLGFGPSAHSFDGKSRRWNVAINQVYIDEIREGSENYYESEITDVKKAFNEYILTALRTKWGIDSGYIQERFGKDYAGETVKKIPRFMQEGLIIQKGEQYILSRKGKLISDYIMTELIIA